MALAGRHGRCSTGSERAGASPPCPSPAGPCWPPPRPASPSRACQGVTVKMGALRLIHSIAPFMYERFQPAGVRIEVIAFESPTDAKNAVVTRSVDFAAFGVAAGILGAAAREPVALVGSACDRGMAVVARKDSGIES